ncbi:hypothetical protein DM01DRAFT_1409500 [Hesseltinella vesiculosa]|uniref:Uncharacterized protein n=1 Tax=Hesseltinella vesiculosa TaxID=101127 RepID=A0A1X2GB37_9FUNG|nr:hypothetical protein DM01DRAFT_1409500 [Hesseltinella vesiculosa]
MASSLESDSSATQPDLTTSSRRSKWKQTLSEKAARHSLFGSTGRSIDNKDPSKTNRATPAPMPAHTASPAISIKPPPVPTPPVPTHRWLLKTTLETDHRQHRRPVSAQPPPRSPTTVPSVQRHTSLRLQAAASAVAYQEDLNPHWQTHRPDAPSLPLPTNHIASLFYNDNDRSATESWQPSSPPPSSDAAVSSQWTAPEFDDPWRVK